MQFYEIDSVFTTGKYEGMTIAEVYQKDPKYIKFCTENLDDFYVSPAVMRELKSMNRSINDSALLGANFDKMSDDEIADFIDGHEDEDTFSADKLDEDFDFEDADIADDSPFDEFDDDFNDEDIDEGFGDDGFGASDDSGDDLY